MKRPLLLILTVFSFVDCKKFPGPLPAIQPSVPTISSKIDTIPDKAAFGLELAKDSINTDETLFIFNHKASTAYFLGDAAYFPGFGQVSLASISSDGHDLAINSTPYIPGRPIGLDVHTKASGAFLFKISYENHIPSYIQVWLVDTYLEDSVDVRSENYNFTISKSDTNSFGNERFKVVVKENMQQQTASLHY